MSNNGDSSSSSSPSQTEGASSRFHDRSSSEPANSQQPTMGVPGISAFSPYIRAPPPPETMPNINLLPTSGALHPFAGGNGFNPAIAVSVGGSSGVTGGGRGVTPLPKRRKGAVPLPGGSQCGVCQRWFKSPQSLFGHMRFHPDRGWKGAFPPPTFRAEEEFADLVGRLENVPTAMDGGKEGEPLQGEGSSADQQQVYGIPDLNASPPSDADD